MDTNFQMLKQLNKVYKPSQFGVCTTHEYELITKTLCLKEMDILQLRNLRDFTVMFYIHKDKFDMEESDKMSAITYIIDSHIIDLGGEV